MQPNMRIEGLLFPKTPTTLVPTSSNFQDRNSLEPLSPKKMRLMVLPSDCSNPADSEEEEQAKPKERTGPSGEHRLTIIFESYGKKGKHPQSFGKYNTCIPDGLKGTHKMYGEHWQFEITHGQEEIEPGLVCLTFKMTNLTSGDMHSRTETSREAKVRKSNGNTILTKIFRAALESRAAQLEEQIKTEENQLRKASIASHIKALRPKQFLEGPLAFGLLHRTVQEKLENHQ